MGSNFDIIARTRKRVFYVGRTEATGKPTQPSYRQFLRNEEGKTVWACDNIIVNSPKSVEQADTWMMEFVDGFNGPVTLIDQERMSRKLHLKEGEG